MKMNKFFFFALAALSMTACSKDDASGNEDGGQKGLVETISVSIVDSKGGSVTRGDYDGMAAGEGTENNVYCAFVFARELNPGHPGALIGDWTVKQVGTLGGGALNGNSGTSGSLTNMCSFKDVRQGENVYVIANDPNMTIEYAEQISRHGPDSENYIKGYISELSKTYLNSLVKSVATVNTQAGKFIMAGKATIQTKAIDDNLDGSTKNVPVEVALDRELSKVAFSATVTANAADEAYDKVEISTTAGSEDGIVVVRIPRKVSFFTQMDRDWYFPAKLALGDQLYKDWGMTTAVAASAGWEKVFKGEAQAFNNPATPGAAGTFFNDHVFNDAAKEYRLTWKLDNGDLTNGLITYKVGTGSPSPSNSTMEAPIFYTTPNYADDAASSTVICTQATIKKPILINDLLTNKPYQALYDVLQPQLAAADPAWTTNVDWTASTNAKVTAFLKLIADETPNPTMVAAVKSAIAKVYSLTGSAAIDERYDAVKGEATTDKDATGAGLAALVRFKTGDKVYYRADVARYANGVSQKVTERNTYYQVKGTISSIGARTIEEAITTTLVGMTIQVTVKNWSVVVSEVNM